MNDIYCLYYVQFSIKTSHRHTTRAMPSSLCHLPSLTARNMVVIVAKNLLIVRFSPSHKEWAPPPECKSAPGCTFPIPYSCTPHTPPLPGKLRRGLAMCNDDDDDSALLHHFPPHFTLFPKLSQPAGAISTPFSHFNPIR